MKKIAFGLLILLMNINIVKAEPSAFFKSFEVVNGTMSSKFSLYNDMYTVYLDEGEYNLVFNYELEDEDATIIIYNNDYIEDDGEVMIKVISGDASLTKNYYFNVYRLEDESVFLEENTPFKLEISKKQKYHLESVIAIVTFLIILFFFYKLFLT